MTDNPFSAEWHEPVKVFGKLRAIPAHDFYQSEEELAIQLQQLQAKGITQITSYKRIDGEWKEITRND